MAEGKEYAIRVDKEGRVHFVFHDGHPGLDLGPAQIRRVSDVVWIEEKQMWKIQFHPDTCLDCDELFQLRSEAIAREVELLFERLSAGLPVFPD